MIHEKKVSVGAGYVQKTKYSYDGKDYDADIKDGDIVKILDEGISVQKEFKGKITNATVHKIETRNGTKAMSLNQTTLNNLIDAFGKDSKAWVDKKVKVFIVKAMVSGKLQNIAYLAPEGWEMNDEGKFLVPEKSDASVSNSEGEDDINFDESDQGVEENNTPFPDSDKPTKKK